MAKKRGKRKADSPPVKELLNDKAYKEVIYDKLGVLVAAKVNAHGRLSKSDSREVFEAVVELIFDQALRTGYFRFPLGYGSLQARKFTLRKPKPMPTRPDLPEAPVAKPGEWLHLRYREGTAVKDYYGTNTQKFARQRPRRSRLDPQRIVLSTPPV